MIIKFTKVSLKNFLSTGNVVQDVNLDTSNLTLIVGEIAESGIKNGAGKTVILQSICYALYGKPLTSIKIPNLVNNINKKGMSVALEFEMGKKAYRIERGQKPAFLRFFVDDKEVKQADSNDALGENRHTQTEINRIIGMSHLMFKHIVGLNTFTDPFLKETEAKQREIIEELQGITQISARAEKLKEVVAQTKDGIKEQHVIIKATADANARIENTLHGLEDTERKWSRDHQAKIISLQNDIEALVQIDYEAALTAFDARDAYDAANQQISEAVTPLRASLKHTRDEVASLARQIAQARSAMTTAKTDAGNRLKREVDRKEADVARHHQQITAHAARHAQLRHDRDFGDDQTCACCGQNLAGTDHLKKVHAAIDAQIEDTVLSHKREQAIVDDLQREIEAIRHEIVHAADQAARQVIEFENRINALETEKAEKVAKASEIEDMVGVFEQGQTALGLRPLVPFATRDDLYQTRAVSDMLGRDLENEMAKSNPYLDQIKAISATIVDCDYTTLNVYLSDLKHQEFLMKLLTSKDSFVRKKIVDQNLPYLNARIGHYLQMLSLPQAVVFQSDLSVEITHLGNDYDFEQLSRGEMNRVIMATAFAFRDVWENLNHPINLLWVDELLDQGTCTPGVEAALAILQGMGMTRGKNIFLVSHKEELRSRIDETLLCLKANSFTSFHAHAPTGD